MFLRQYLCTLVLRYVCTSPVSVDLQSAAFEVDEMIKQMIAWVLIVISRRFLLFNFSTLILFFYSSFIRFHYSSFPPFSFSTFPLIFISPFLLFSYSYFPLFHFTSILLFFFSSFLLFHFSTLVLLHKRRREENDNSTFNIKYLN